MEKMDMKLENDTKSKVEDTKPVLWGSNVNLKSKCLDVKPIKNEEKDIKPMKIAEESPELPSIEPGSAELKLHHEPADIPCTPASEELGHVQEVATEPRPALFSPDHEYGDVEMVDLSLDVTTRTPIFSVPDNVRVRQETPEISIVPETISIRGIGRRLIAEVVVPTWAQLQADRKKIRKKLKELQNPNIHKIQDMEFDLDTVASRLKEIGLDPYLIDLPIDIKEFTVSRGFMSATYGGSMQMAFPKIGKRLLELHGMDNFAYVHPHYQPVGPEIPGAPGLFLCSELRERIVGTYRVFTRIRSNVWQHQGIYELKPSIRPFLTVAEWARQDLKVRNTWYRQICIQNWGISVCVRVIGRKGLGRAPTKQEAEDIEGSGRHREATPEDIAKAYMSGEEKMGVWTMKCIGYDKELQKQLCEKFPLWEPPKRRTKPKKGGKTATKSSGNTGGRGLKRKRSKSPDLPGESDPESEDEEPSGREIVQVSDEEEEEEELVYRSRGTKSRPICL